jgi:RNA polymerase sigma factor (sigma-70 family)
MNLFVKHMKLITSVAHSYASLFKGKYDASELINEAYLRYNVAITNNPSLVEGKFAKVGIFLNSVKNDMKDYVRDDTKLRIRQRWEKKGKFFPEFKSTSYKPDDDHNTHLFEPADFRESHEVEREDLFDALFAKVELSNDEWKIIQGYFYDEKTMKEVGKEIGYTECTISTKNKKMCEKLLACAKTLV